MSAAKNRYLADDDKDFTVSDREAIIALLDGLARHNITVSGVFNAGVEVLLTDVLGVDEDADAVFLDVNTNEERNQQFALSKRVIFVAYADGAKIQWATTQLVRDRFAGRDAFRVPLPKTLQRIQRRSAFRIATPVAHPVHCRIPVSPERELLLQLVDICVDGIGVVLPSPPEPAIEKNAQFRHCRLEHDELKIDDLTLSVQNIFDVTLANGTQCQHAGLEFDDIAPSSQAAIQRFVFKLERLKIATSKND